MSIKLFMDQNLEAIKKIIHVKIKNREFDSHEFITHFSKEFEPDYARFLAKYKNQNHRVLHAQIALNLLRMSDELKITKNDKVLSDSVFRKHVRNRKWIKTN